MNKLVSIVIPVYNAEKFLHDSISDIKNQSYVEWELICVDDGSTDSSITILNTFKSDDKRIKVIRNMNKGAGSARNAGLEFATGEYILFLDADDRFEENLLELTVKRAEDLKTDILIFDASCFDSETNKELYSEWLNKKDKFPNKEVFNYEDCPDEILNLSHSVAWDKLYNLEFVKKEQLQFQNTPYGNDVLFTMMSMVKAKRISFLNHKLLRYRQNNKGALSENNIRQKYPLCLCEVMEELKYQIESNGVYDRIWKSFVNFSLETLVYNLELVTRKSYYDLYNKIKYELLENYEVHKLKEEDFITKELLQDVLYLKQHDAEDYLFYLFQKKREAYIQLDRNFFELLGSYIPKLEMDNKKMKEMKRWYFDESKMPKGSRVIIYGAGDVGTDYFKQLKNTNDCKIVAWVDKRYQCIQNKEFQIENPDVVMKKEFDYIIIANADQKVRETIKEYLRNCGISDEKMCC